MSVTDPKTPTANFLSSRLPVALVGPADSPVDRTEGATTPEAGAETVRELAETIVAGHAFADVDAVRVARAFLRMDEEGT